MRPAQFALAAAAALVAGAAAAGALEVTVLDKDGRPVPDAVVAAQPARAGGTPPPLPASATIVQERMQFVPALTLVGPGARITFTNLDSFDHHVRGTAAGLAGLTTAPTDGFELRLDGRRAAAPAKAEVTLSRPGPTLLGCHLHGSMRGHIFVAESPWTARTDADGHAVFDALPDGPAQVRVWHPEQLLDLPAVPVTTAASARARVSLQLQVVPRRRRSS